MYIRKLSILSLGLGFAALSYGASGLSLQQDPFAYSSAYTDSESGQQYLNARYYNPRLMRFATRDSYALIDRYGYGNANPIMNDDPSGHISMSWQAGVGMGIGGLSGVIAGFFTAGVGSFVAVAITEAVIGGASSAISDGVTYALGGKMSWKQAGLDAGLGGAMGVLGSALGAGTGKALRAGANDVAGVGNMEEENINAAIDNAQQNVSNDAVHMIARKNELGKGESFESFSGDTITRTRPKMGDYDNPISIRAEINDHLRRGSPLNPKWSMENYHGDPRYIYQNNDEDEIGLKFRTNKEANKFKPSWTQAGFEDRMAMRDMSLAREIIPGRRGMEGVRFQIIDTRPPQF